MDKKRLDSISQPIVDIYTTIEHDMLINIAGRLKINKNLLEQDPEAWQLQRLENLGVLDKESLKIIQKHAGLTSQELNRILLNAGLEGVNLNEKEMKDALKKGADLIEPVPVSESPQVQEILKSYQQQANNVLNLTNQSLVSQVNKTYVGIINQVATEMMVGSITGDQAIRKTIRQLSEKGIPVFVDRAGRQRGVEGYIRSVMMTTSNNLVNEMQDARLNEWGVDLVEISSHAGNRPGCVPYAGKIFSLTPDHPKYKYLYDPSVGRIGAPDSLFGVNCGHIKYPFVEGISEQRYFPNDPKKNKEDYEASQKQRTIERSIRKAKTQEQMMIAAGDKEGAVQANKLVKARQARMREFIDESGRTRRYNREQVYGFSTKNVRRGKLMQKEWYKHNGPRTELKPIEEPKPPKKRAPRKKAPAKKKGPVSSIDSTVVDKNFNKLWSNKTVKQLRDDFERSKSQADRNAAIIDFTKGLTKKSKMDDIEVKVSNLNSAWGIFRFYRRKKGFIDGVSLELNEKDKRPIQYRVKTALHEFYHTKAHNVKTTHLHKMDNKGVIYNFNNDLEETFTEISALRMKKMIGFEEEVMPSYSDKIVRNLPRLQKLPEFKDAKTFDDFAKIMMKKRFGNDEEVTVEFFDYYDHFEKNVDDVKFKKYIDKNYKDYILKNQDEIIKIISEGMNMSKFSVYSQFNKAWESDRIGVNDGNSFYTMSIAIAMQRIGVKPYRGK